MGSTGSSPVLAAVWGPVAQLGTCVWVVAGAARVGWLASARKGAGVGWRELGAGAATNEPSGWWRF